MPWFFICYHSCTMLVLTSSTREAFVDFNTALELMPGNRALRRVILRMKEEFRSDMSASFMSSCSNESIRFIDDGSAVEMDT